MPTRDGDPAARVYVEARIPNLWDEGVLLPRSFWEFMHGVLLRKARLASGKTLREVAEHLHVSVTYLSDVERGKRPPLSVERIWAAAALMGLTKDETLVLLPPEVRRLRTLETEHDRFRRALETIRFYGENGNDGHVLARLAEEALKGC